MNKRIQRLALLAVTVLLGLAGAVFQPRINAIAVTQVDAKAVTQKVCGSSCHALDRATGAPRNRQQWEDVMSKMVSMGAKATDEETLWYANLGAGVAKGPISYEIGWRAICRNGRGRQALWLCNARQRYAASAFATWQINFE
jgi:hypothetical protein